MLCQKIQGLVVGKVPRSCLPVLPAAAKGSRLTKAKLQHHQSLAMISDQNGGKLSAVDVDVDSEPFQADFERLRTSLQMATPEPTLSDFRSIRSRVTAQSKLSRATTMSSKKGGMVTATKPWQ